MPIIQMVIDEINKIKNIDKLLKAGVISFTHINYKEIFTSYKNYQGLGDKKMLSITKTAVKHGCSDRTVFRAISFMTKDCQ